MRSNKYDNYHTSSNTPQYLLKSVLLFCSTFFTGINVIVIILKHFSGDYEMLWYGIIIAADFILVSILQISDKRIGMRNLPYIIVWLCIWSVGIIILFFTAWTIALITLSAEVLITVSAAWIFNRIKIKKNAENLKN